MAPLTFPLSLAEFWDRLPVARATLAPTDSTVTSRTRGGEILTAQLGNVLWHGTVTLASRHPHRLEWAAARLQLLRRGGSFLATPAHRRGPIFDPDGAMLGVASPKINDIDLTRREVQIIDLPPGYLISPGDYLSYTYGSNPTRYAFHQVVTGDQADAGGVAAGIEVVPPIPAGVPGTFGVTLVAPAFRAVLAEPPGYGAHRPMFLDDMSFSFMQTLGG